MACGRASRAAAVPQQHGGAQDRAARIRDALARDVGRRAVDRLVEPGPPSPSDAEGSKPIEPASIEASSVRMSPNMFSVTMTSKSAGPAQQVHRRRRRRADARRRARGNSVRNTRVATSRHRRDVSSTLALSTGRDLAAPSHRELAGDAAHALDLRRPCTRSVSNAASAVRVALAEVDAARELADHEDVDALELLGLQRRRGRELGHVVTGRRFANRPSALRIASRPCSGRCCTGMSAHSGRPRRRAGCPSDALHAATVASGSGEPAASYAAPPINASSNSRPSLCLTDDLLEHAHGLRRDFGADAVAGQHDDVRAHACARS